MAQFPAWDLEHSHEIPSGTGFYGSFLTSELCWLCCRASFPTHSCSGLSCVTPLSPVMHSALTGLAGRLEGAGAAGRDGCSWKVFAHHLAGSWKEGKQNASWPIPASLSLWPHVAKLGCCQGSQEICPCRGLSAKLI